MISVIIPTYNRARYLAVAIDSVLAQTCQDFEIIVVDDCSTDNTKEIIAGYKDRVRYIFQENKERGAARNNGIVNCRGKYIALLDSDDYWLPAHLEYCLNALNSEPNAKLSFSGSYIVDTDGKILSKMNLRISKGHVLRNIVSEFSSGGCNASSCLIDRDIFGEVGMFNEDRALSGSEDWEMWVRIAAQTKFIPTNEYTAMIRFHDEKSSLNADNMANSMKLAMDAVYNNMDIFPKIKNIKKKAYSSMYTVIATNYYSTGNMLVSRKYIKKAILSNPRSIFINKYLVYTLLRSCLGTKLSFYFRKIKWMINNIIYHRC